MKLLLELKRNQEKCLNLSLGRREDVEGTDALIMGFSPCMRSDALCGQNIWIHSLILCIFLQDVRHPEQGRVGFNPLLLHEAIL